MQPGGIFIGVGSNIEPEANVLAALRALAGRVRIAAVSTFYATPALHRPEQPIFYNGVVEVATEIGPLELKQGVLRPIEERLGRKRTEDPYAPRSIDLDLLLYHDLILAVDGILLPDPDVQCRPFLAIPLHELAPGLVLPGSGRPLAEVAQGFAGAEMMPLPDYTCMLRRELLDEPQEG